MKNKTEYKLNWLLSRFDLHQLYDILKYPIYYMKYRRGRECVCVSSEIQKSKKLRDTVYRYNEINKKLKKKKEGKQTKRAGWEEKMNAKRVEWKNGSIERKRRKTSKKLQKKKSEKSEDWKKKQKKEWR